MAVPDAIINTSPLLYLSRIGVANWLPKLFSEVWTSSAVVRELNEGKRKKHDVPNPGDYGWLKIVEPHIIHSEWLALDLGAGELATLSLALEYPKRIVLLDDELARRIAKSAGLTVWGTLRVLLVAKKQGLTQNIKPLINQLKDSGMWLSDEIRKRILRLANEKW